MITIKDKLHDSPYELFYKKYKQAYDLKQNNIEAAVISSYNSTLDFPDARYVNIKYLIRDEWTFFSNYESEKSQQFESNSNITTLFFWNTINTQIRIRSKIYKTDKFFSDYHFSKRSNSKNALAISSKQSLPIEDYSMVKNNYEKALKNIHNLKRPEYWGGYTFKPFYFEFWFGHRNRLNKRIVFKKSKSSWTSNYLQP